MFELKSSRIEGCYEIQPKIFTDSRGEFVKVFHEQEFIKNNLSTNYREEYYSRSHRGVIRGMHFQVPPMDHHKLVYCVHGEVFDVVVDLRVGSPTYGATETFTLSANKGNYIYIDKGMAHGFCAVSDDAVLVYKVTSVYAAECDAGVLWSSLDIDWPTESPVVSVRDESFPELSKFISPFTY